MIPSSLFLLLLATLLLCLQQTSANQAAITQVKRAAPQTSVTSTSFNPAETNPGGTTNSAGTFDVVSLSRSSSYSFDSSLPTTTSFVVVSPNIASPGVASTPSYFTDTASATTGPASIDTTSISLVSSISGVSSVSALTTVQGNADAATMVSVSHQLTWTLLLSGAAAVIGALFVL